MRWLKWKACAVLTVAGAIVVGCVSETSDSLLNALTGDVAESAARAKPLTPPEGQESGEVPGGGVAGNGNDNGTNDNTNGGTNDNTNGGTNDNTNGGTNDNTNGGTNGNDNGTTNGNDNGTTNGNDNGATNGNDNGSGGFRRGDMNCDGLVNNFDIDPFGVALGDAAVYAALWPGCNIMAGDVNCDGLFNNFDINPFVALLANGGGTPCDNANGNDNGTTNGNDNGTTNGKDNGTTNGNDNGTTNGNDNGTTNGNDNGTTNGNDNGGGGGTCPDGSTQLSASLSGGGSGSAEYREVAGGACKRFRVRTDSGPANSALTVRIQGVAVGTLFTDSRGRGELRYDTSDGNFPANFPAVHTGDVVTVGTSISGTLTLDCSNYNCNS
ncbi:MAG: hypothetical protein JNG88_02640 [Phycisphaerales bacterium]|nr:hypothetical protein [Phycisphaerales bacterium]